MLRVAERQDAGQAQQGDEQGRDRAPLRGGSAGIAVPGLSVRLVEGGIAPLLCPAKAADLCASAMCARVTAGGGAKPAAAWRSR